MSGFELPRRTGRLVFEEYPDLEATCSMEMSLGGFYEFVRAAESEDPGQVIEAFRRFGDDVLESWNLEIKGEPVPATADGFLRLPPEFASRMVRAWTEAMQGVPAPLGEPSPNGGTSRAGSTRRGTKSPSRSRS